MSRTRKRSGVRQNTTFQNTDDNTDTDNTDGEENATEKEHIAVDIKPSPFVYLLLRTITASVLSILFLGLLQTGHFYCILASVITQIELFRELVNVRYTEAKERRMPLFRTLQWSWFIIAMFWAYGETFHEFCSEHKQLLHLTRITQFVDSIVFIGYCSLLIATVLTFRKGLLRFQFSQLMWTLLTIVIVVGQCKFLGTNTLNGLFWFYFPMATVVMNDVSAYFCGITMGKRFVKAPFLAISPNKTWEGFIGAGILTLLFSFFFPALLARWTWFTCPPESLYLYPFPPKLECEPLPVFISFTYDLPDWLSGSSLELMPIQFHGLAYGIFASVVAPFGGFLASAIKRAYKIKDFDSFIPGHGGMMDRMDCQLLIVCFTYVHYNTFIVTHNHTVKSIFASISLLTLEDQLKLLQLLQASVKEALISESVSSESPMFTMPTPDL